jgi:acetylornithine deacetylase/succinyl-diaminopimelate desuccinylase-like protein
VDTLNIGAIEGGSLDIKEGKIMKGAGNVIAKHASARVDIRLTEKTSHDKAYGIIDRIIAAKQKEIGPAYKIERSPVTKVEHLNTPESRQEVKDMIKAYEKAKGRKPEIVGEHGASDGRFFSVKGIPSILFGCTSVGYHSTDERAEIASIEDCYVVLENYIISS